MTDTNVNKLLDDIVDQAKELDRLVFEQNILIAGGKDQKAAAKNREIDDHAFRFSDLESGLEGDGRRRLEKLLEAEDFSYFSIHPFDEIKAFGVKRLLSKVKELERLEQYGEAKRGSEKETSEGINLQ
jgi:hypothetical protein